MRPKNLEKEEAIRTIALQMIAEDGLENLSMQKLAKAANVSPRTIYIKYENKDDLLVTLFITDVLGAYEKAVLKGFDPQMGFAAGVKHLWMNAYRYLKNNRHAFALMLYGRSSPLLNKAFAKEGIKQGTYFAPIHAFIKQHIAAGTIANLPFDVYRAVLFAPLLDLVNEHFDYKDRPKQIITDKVVATCCDMMIKGLLKA